MSEFRVELKKVVDDSYDILIGHNLRKKLVEGGCDRLFYYKK